MKFHLPEKFFRGYSILEKVNSEINGLIEIREDIFGRKNLLVGGISQSGHSIEKLWQKPLGRIKDQRLRVKNCLILGFGAGSVVKVIHNLFPKAKVVGIEIDPIMIKMGKKYFDLSTVKNLKAEVGDAIIQLKNPNYFTQKFNLVLIDVYVGDKVPKKAETNEFIKNIKQLLSPSGVAIFNRLYYGEKRREAEAFRIKLEKVFLKVESFRIDVSVFFLCQCFLKMVK